MECLLLLQDVNLNTQGDVKGTGTSYSATEMLQKCFARTKCTKAQIYFRVSKSFFVGKY